MTASRPFCRLSTGKVNAELNGHCTLFSLALILLLSMTAGKRGTAGSKRATGSTVHAAYRPAADEHASSSRSSNEGSEKPSQQPQQQPQSSSHASPGASKPATAQRSNGRPKAAGSSSSNAGPRQPGRPPGAVAAPTSENYPPDSVHYFTLQVMWRKREFPGEAAFRVYVAISAVRKAAAEYAEQIEQALSRVCASLIFLSVKSISDAMPCLLCYLPNHDRQQALLPDSRPGACPLHAQT